jgi:hypothetical protein
MPPPFARVKTDPRCFLVGRQALGRTPAGWWRARECCAGGGGGGGLGEEKEEFTGDTGCDVDGSGRGAGGRGRCQRSSKQACTKDARVCRSSAQTNACQRAAPAAGSAQRGWHSAHRPAAGRVPGHRPARFRLFRGSRRQWGPQRQRLERWLPDAAVRGQVHRGLRGWRTRHGTCQAPRPIMLYGVFGHCHNR